MACEFGRYASGKCKPNPFRRALRTKQVFGLSFTRRAKRKRVAVKACAGRRGRYASKVVGRVGACKPKLKGRKRKACPPGGRGRYRLKSGKLGACKPKLKGRHGARKKRGCSAGRGRTKAGTCRPKLRIGTLRAQRSRALRNLSRFSAFKAARAAL